MKFINKMLQKWFKKRYSKKTFRGIDKELLTVFSKNGDGIYYMNVKPVSHNFLSRAIAWFSGGWTHTVPVVYMRKGVLDYVFQNFGITEHSKLLAGLNEYYKDYKESDLQALIIGSADNIGLTVCSASAYQLRKFTLRKMNDLGGDKQNKCIKFLLDKIGDPYDATGMVFQPLSNVPLLKVLYGIFDTDNLYCSEQVEEMANVVNRTVARRSNPSPGHIEEANVYPIIFLRGV